MRRMRAIAEANQLVEERIVVEAKKAEKNNKSDNDGSSGNCISTKKSDEEAYFNSSDFIFNADFSSSDENPFLQKPQTTLSAISFSEFVDDQYKFLSPKSRASRQYTARQDYLQASAKLSESAYDRAVEKVRKMPSILKEALECKPAENPVVAESPSFPEPENLEEMPWTSMLYGAKVGEIETIVDKIENRLSQESLVFPTPSAKKFNSFKNFSNLSNTALPSSKYDRATLMALAKDPHVSAEHYRKIAREAFRG